VDGGLDGLSTIQAIRETITDHPPIITCYPTFRKTFAPYLESADAWVEFLAISGADIIYPGGRPTFRDASGRFVAGEDLEKSVMEAQAHYRRFLDRGWPMPSFAAGPPNAGELQVAQHLLGGGTAMFLGEALASSTEDISEAGRYIAKLVDATAAQIGAAARGEDMPSLPHDVLREYKRHYPSHTFVPFDEIFKDEWGATPLWVR
jgi:hypothetical protein